jgi:hypothetical protein
VTPFNVRYDIRFARQAFDLVRDRLWLLPDALNAIGRAIRVDIP